MVVAIRRVLAVLCTLAVFGVLAAFPTAAAGNGMHGRPPCVGQDRKLPECQTPSPTPTAPLGGGIIGDPPPTFTAVAATPTNQSVSSPTSLPTETNTVQPSPTAKATATASPSYTAIATHAATATATTTLTATTTITPTSVPATRTPTRTPTTTPTATATKSVATPTATTPPAATIVGPTYDYTQQRTLLVGYINQTRAEQNDPAIQPLTIDARIMRVAQWKAQDMNARHYTDHLIPAGACYTNSQGVTTCWDHDIYVWDVLGAEGIGGGVGENVWLGPPLGDSEASWCNWVFFNHEGHHENMLDPSWHYVGTGMAYYTWTQGVNCIEVFTQFQN